MMTSLTRLILAAILICPPLVAHASFKAGADGLPEGWKLFRINEKVAATQFKLLAEPESAV